MTHNAAIAACGLPGRTIGDLIKRGHLKTISSGRHPLTLRDDLLEFLRRAPEVGSIDALVSRSARRRFAALSQNHSAEQRKHGRHRE